MTFLQTSKPKSEHPNPLPLPIIRFWNGSELSTRISNPSARRHTPRLLASSGGSKAAVSECMWCPCPRRSKGKETIPAKETIPT